MTDEISTPLSKDERAQWRKITGDVPIVALRESGMRRNAETVADLFAQYEYMATVLKQYMHQEDELRENLDKLNQEIQMTGRLMRRMGFGGLSAQDAFKSVYAAMAIRHEFTLDDLKAMASMNGVDL